MLGFACARDPSQTRGNPAWEGRPGDSDGGGALKSAREVKRRPIGFVIPSHVKVETKSFYLSAVQQAVARITEQLDEALDLAVLARAAALSPFHFFRGMVGETPLELQRRLRMERAAHRLLHTDKSVTTLAFESGYDTHEAFTRAFRALYGVPPSAFRQSSPSAAECLRPQQVELAAPSGIHFRTSGTIDPFVPFTTGDHVMNVEVKTMPALRLATVHHVGPYSKISEAFARLGAIAGQAGLFQQPSVAMIGVYHDDPETTPAHELQSDAAISVPEAAVLPAGLSELRLPAGRYACTTHVGPYTTLGDTWSRLMGEWLPKSGQRMQDSVAYELYLNNPMTAPAEELRTEIYILLAA